MSAIYTRYTGNFTNDLIFMHLHDYHIYRLPDFLNLMSTTLPLDLTWWFLLGFCYHNKSTLKLKTIKKHCRQFSRELIEFLFELHFRKRELEIKSGGIESPQHDVAGKNNYLRQICGVLKGLYFLYRFPNRAVFDIIYECLNRGSEGDNVIY